MAQDSIERSRQVKVYLGLGSNMGKRHKNLSRALDLLSPQVQIERISSIYETEPVGYLDQPRFLNAVLRGSTLLSPQMLLSKAKEIEKSLGRVPSFQNAPRPIDIDILLYGRQVIRLPELTIPQPRLEERAFILVPLAEIAPGFVHPISGQIVRKILEKVKGREGIRKWKQEAKDV